MNDKNSVEIGFIHNPKSTTIGDSKIAVNAATISDTQTVIDVITEAFSTDPTWSWAFPDPSTRQEFWKLAIKGGIRYPYIFKSNGFETVAVWIPPDGSEFTPEDDENLPDILKYLVGNRASDVMELLMKFSDSHPRNELHYYLSLLGVQNSARGLGFGMALLKENLARIDAEKMPAYLESSNPMNNKKYESVGFVPIVSFQAPGDGPIVTGMWRQSK